MGIRSYRAIFNVPGDPLAELVEDYRQALDTLSGNGEPRAGRSQFRGRLAGFTRGHFDRAV
jgi:hypothetical protein